MREVKTNELIIGKRYYVMSTLKYVAIHDGTNNNEPNYTDGS